MLGLFNFIDKVSNLAVIAGFSFLLGPVNVS
jgi:hypothetical protein